MGRHLPVFFRSFCVGMIIAACSHSASAILISYVWGFVTDPNGNPVAGGDLDFDNAITGERLYTPGDNTGPDGFYGVWVPNGIYNISYAPPQRTHLLGLWRYNESLFNANVQIDVTLNFGKTLSGIGRGNGLPVPDVDLDADNLATGERIFTPNDNTDSLGEYWIVVPSGEYRVRYQPPAGSRWLGIQLDSVSIFTDRVMNVVFTEGMLFDGYVRDILGNGLDSITVDLRAEADGEKIFLNFNRTDSTGYYDVAVPTGLFQLRYVPPPASRYVGVAIDSFAIDGDMTRDQVLETGWLLAAYVHDSTGNAVDGADLDIIQESTGIKLYTPNDKTDSTGNTIVTLPPDTYTIRVQPPPGSIYDRVVVNGVTISADTSMDFTMPEVPKVNISGRIVNVAGDGLAGIDINFADTVLGTRIYVADNVSDSLGYYNMFVPIGGFNVEIAPPRGSRYTGELLGTTIIDRDTTWDDIFLIEGYIVSATVLGPQALPVEDADFDFILENTGLPVFTPHDNTDISGTVDIAVRPGTYTITVTPFPGSPLEQTLITGFSVASDTSLTVFLREGGGVPPVAFILNDNYPNPFNESTNISYVLFIQTNVSLVIYNALGQRVTELNRGNQPPGFYTMGWSGIDERGRSIASGLYFYELKTSGGSSTHSMLLVR